MPNIAPFFKLPDMAVAVDYKLGGGQFGKAHGTTGMQFLEC